MARRGDNTRGRGPGGLRVHPHQEERFEVVNGTVRFRIRRERIIAKRGEHPPG